MGGIVGGVVGKIVLGTTALLLSAKIDQRNVFAVIDGDAPTSAISERLADRLHVASPGSGTSATPRLARVWLALEGGIFKVTMPVAEHGLVDRADVRLGQDILAAHTIRLDFRHNTSRLILRDRLASETRAMIAIPIDTAPDGTILVPIRMHDGVSGQARLQFNFHVEAGDAHSESAGSPITILSEDDAKAFEVGDYHVDGAGRASTVFVDLLAFDDRVIVLDLTHKRLWVSGRRSPA